jgi:hypothetical protein
VVLNRYFLAKLAGGFANPDWQHEVDSVAVPVYDDEPPSVTERSPTRPQLVVALGAEPAIAAREHRNLLDRIAKSL